MMKKRIYLSLVILLAVIFTLSSGATLAYWVSEGAAHSHLSINKINAEIVEEYEQGQLLYPGDVVDKVVNVVNTGDVDSLIRVKISKAWGEVRENGVLVVNPSYSTDNIDINYNTSMWLYDSNDDYFYYKGVLKPGQTTNEPLFEQFSVLQSTQNNFGGLHADIDIYMECIQAGYGGESVWGKTLGDLDITYVPPVISAEKATVAFENPNKGFSFEFGANDILYSWDKLIPGESRSQIITIKNNYSMKVPIYFNAVYENYINGSYERKLVEELLTKYVTIHIVDENGKTVYSGFLRSSSETDAIQNGFIYLGDFDSGESKDYSFTISVSTEVDNEYQELWSKIRWGFKTEGDKVSQSPKTGSLNVITYAIISFISSLLLIIIISLRKRLYTQER